MVLIHLAEGFEEIEALTVVDLLRRVKIEVKLVAVTQELIVKGAHDISVKADITFDKANYNNCNMIVLPGGMPGTTNLGNHQGLIKEIKELNNKGRYIAAICAAPMVLGKEGILKGKNATIFPGMEQYLEGANKLGDNVVVDGNVITSKGPGTAMEFALKLVEILKDKNTAEQLRRDLLLNGQ